MRVLAVVTTRDEVDTIGALVAQLVMTVDGVIVIDEGSTDGTRSMAKLAGAALVRGHSGGIGPCLMFGWKQALLHGADRIVQIDAGGSHDAALIPKLLRERADVVIGSRFNGGRHEGAWWRSLGSRTYGWLWRLRLDEPVRDWTSGYRVFTKHAVETLAKHDYNCVMHGWQAEVVAHAATDGLSVSEYPITYTTSESSLSWRVTREALRGWWRWGR